MGGPNRVVVGLPERYEKAKREIARFEQREKELRICLTLLPRGRTVDTMRQILDGKHDK